MTARYVHTNLIARDWRRLARFYVDVFGCVPVPPERDLAGAWLDAATGIPGASIRGLHLRLPGGGGGGDGPTLEVFTYESPSASTDSGPPRPDQLGYAHLALAVDDEATSTQIMAGGGAPVGAIVQQRFGDRLLTMQYLRDPEGNVIEIQRWDNFPEETP